MTSMNEPVPATSPTFIERVIEVSARNRFLVADVRGERPSTERLRHCRRGHILAVHDHDGARLFFAEPLAERSADAVSSAGDNCDLALDQHGDILLRTRHPERLEVYHPGRPARSADPQTTRRRDR